MICPTCETFEIIHLIGRQKIVAQPKSSTGAGSLSHLVDIRKNLAMCLLFSRLIHFRCRTKSNSVLIMGKLTPTVCLDAQGRVYKQYAGVALRPQAFFFFKFTIKKYVLG